MKKRLLVYWFLQASQITALKSISCYWFHSLPIENTRKLVAFWFFQGYRKRPVASYGLVRLHQINTLTLLWWRSLSYRNQFINLLCKSMDWFLYDRDLRHKRVKNIDLLRNKRKNNWIQRGEQDSAIPF